MGICNSYKKKGQTQKINQPSTTQTRKPQDNTPNEEVEEKSNDTMDYQKIPLYQSFNSNTNIKKPDINSNDEKEKSTDYTNLQQMNQELINNTSKKLNINQNQSYISSNSQEGLSQNGSQAFNNNNYNLIQSSQHSKNYYNKSDQYKYPMDTSIGGNNNIKQSGQYRFNNNIQKGSNIFIKNSNNSKINVSIHESHVSKSAFLNVPNQDNDPMISISISESMLQSQ